MRFKDALKAELDQRRASHLAYSLRRFARVLGVHHTTASRLLQKSGPVPERSIRAIGKRLGLEEAAIEGLCVVERDEAVLAAIEQAGFRPATRWISSAAGIPVDQVNIALQALIRTGRLRMASAKRWETRRDAA